MTIRWGIVTAGKISHDFVTAFNSHPDVGDQAIVAVAARNKGRAADFAKQHNIPHVFDSYQALAASKDIDIAYIGSLIPDHYKLSKLFLENGKHVLCEKPLCLNSKQVQSLINLSKKNKLFLMEAIWSRFSPAYLQLEKDINSGLLGEIKFVEVNFGVPIHHLERIRKKELGGGAVLDLGVYALQFAQFIFKEEPIKVTTVGELNEDGVDIADTVVLQYKGGKRAVLNFTATVKLWNKATVTGSKGYLTVEEPFHFPTKLTGVDGKTLEFPLRESNLKYNFDNSAGLVYEALEVAKCIQQGLTESPRLPHKESLLLAKLEETVRKQAGAHFDVDDQEFP